MTAENRLELTAKDEVLFRQVYPNWLEEEGRPSSQAFHPWRPVDQGYLSVDRGSLTTPEAAYTLFTDEKPHGFGADSAGVWGLSVGEVTTSGVSPWEDPVPATQTTPANPAHALLDFNTMEPKTWKKTGRLLKVKAWERGRLYPP